MYTEHAMTTHLRLIESDAVKIYTLEIFKEVRHAITKAGSLIVKVKRELGDTKMYTLTKYCNDKYHRELVCDGSSFQCSCRLFDSRGHPCSHIFYVMKHKHVDHMPRSIVFSRWMKEAQTACLNNMGCNENVDSNLMELGQFGAYCSVFTTLCKEASKKDDVYGQIMDDILKLQKKYCSNEDPVVGTQNSVVGDPMMVKSKGAPKRKKNDTKAVRHCTKCNTATHNERRCSVNFITYDMCNSPGPTNLGGPDCQLTIFSTPFH
jgi:hypothetical protein